LKKRPLDFRNFKKGGVKHLAIIGNSIVKHTLYTSVVLANTQAIQFWDDQTAEKQTTEAALSLTTVPPDQALNKAWKVHLRSQT